MTQTRKSVRLHKYIANCGYTSRRRAELLILAGRVEINGKLETSVGVTVDPARDTVCVNGEEVVPPTPMTIILNKPSGVLTSTHDTHDRLTVMDVLPRRFRHDGVLPAGRLDQNTEGLLILTNNGDLAHRITHPRYETEKEYVALVSGQPSGEKLKRLETGVMIDGRKTAPAKIVFCKPHSGQSRVGIVLREGRKRQVRRMFQAIHHEVISLTRIRIGRLRLKNLPVGEWRELTAPEIDQLIGKDEHS